MLTGRSLAGVAAGFALVLSLAGCRAVPLGKEHRSESPAVAARTVVRQASARTAGLRSFRASVSFAYTGKDGGRVDGELAYRLSPDLAMEFDVPEWDDGYSEILLGGEFYLRVTQHDIQQPWKAYPLAAAQRQGVDVTLLESEIHQADPTLYAAMFTASRDVLAAGQETIDGVPTTRYHGHFALDDALAALDTHQRAEMRSLWQTPGGSGPLNFTAWIDGHHLIRRIIMTTPDEAKKGLTATIDYAAFDVPVDITAPPAEQAHGKLTGDDLHVPA